MTEPGPHARQQLQRLRLRLRRLRWLRRAATTTTASYRPQEESHRRAKLYRRLYIGTIDVHRVSPGNLYNDSKTILSVEFRRRLFLREIETRVQLEGNLISRIKGFRANPTWNGVFYVISRTELPRHRNFGRSLETLNANRDLTTAAPLKSVGRLFGARGRRGEDGVVRSRFKFQILTGAVSSCQRYCYRRHLHVRGSRFQSGRVFAAIAASGTKRTSPTDDKGSRGGEIPARASPPLSLPRYSGSFIL